MSNRINYIVELTHSWWVMWLFAWSILENLIPPIPSELIMPRWWYLAVSGNIHIFWYSFYWYYALFVAILVGSLWSTIWSIPYYFIWKVISKKMMTNFVEKYGKYIFISVADVDYIYEIYQKHGWKLTFFGRILPLGRGFVWLPAGSTNMPFERFFMYTFWGSFLRVSILSYIWYYLWDKYINESSSVINLIQYVVIGLVLILIISLWVSYISKNYFRE